MKRISILAWFMALSICMNAQSITDTDLFDFWVGKWDATWSEGEDKIGKGTNEITKTLDGKVLQENFRITEGQNVGFKGTSISVYNPRKKEWKQAWADNNGGYFDFTGDLDGDKRIFKTATKEGSDGSKIIQRMIFYDITDKSMTWDWESTKDGGENWNLLWRINYTKSN